MNIFRKAWKGATAETFSFRESYLTWLQLWQALSHASLHNLVRHLLKKHSDQSTSSTNRLSSTHHNLLLATKSFSAARGSNNQCLHIISKLKLSIKATAGTAPARAGILKSIEKPGYEIKPVTAGKGVLITSILRGQVYYFSEVCVSGAMNNLKNIMDRCCNKMVDFLLWMFSFFLTEAVWCLNVKEWRCKLWPPNTVKTYTHALIIVRRQPTGEHWYEKRLFWQTHFGCSYQIFLFHLWFHFALCKYPRQQITAYCTNSSLQIVKLHAG